jgi:hypothetical protein
VATRNAAERREEKRANKKHKNSPKKTERNRIRCWAAAHQTQNTKTQRHKTQNYKKHKKHTHTQKNSKTQKNSTQKSSSTKQSDEAYAIGRRHIAARVREERRVEHLVAIECVAGFGRPLPLQQTLAG